MKNILRNILFVIFPILRNYSLEYCLCNPFYSQQWFIRHVIRSYSNLFFLSLRPVSVKFCKPLFIIMCRRIFNNVVLILSIRFLLVVIQFKTLLFDYISGRWYPQYHPVELLSFPSVLFFICKILYALHKMLRTWYKKKTPGRILDLITLSFVKEHCILVKTLLPKNLDIESWFCASERLDWELNIQILSQP